MLRGVNKQIIEINETENKLFERAVLYVRPEYSDLSATKLYNSAKEFIKDAAVNDLWCVDIKNENNSDKIKKGKKAVILSVFGTFCLILAIIVALIKLL